MRDPFKRSCDEQGNPICTAGEHVIGPKDYFYTINPPGGYGQAEVLCCEVCIRKPEWSHFRQRMIDAGNKELRVKRMDWPDVIEMGARWDELTEPVFLDVNLYDIPETITRAVRGFARWPMIAAISVHNSCLDAARAGQVDGKPDLIAVGTVEVA